MINERITRPAARKREKAGSDATMRSRIGPRNRGWLRGPALLPVVKAWASAGRGGIRGLVSRKVEDSMPIEYRITGAGLASVLESPRPVRERNMGPASEADFPKLCFATETGIAVMCKTVARCKQND